LRNTHVGSAGVRSRVRPIGYHLTNGILSTLHSPSNRPIRIIGYIGGANGVTAETPNTMSVRDANSQAATSGVCGGCSNVSVSVYCGMRCSQNV
jgi:hypothetical protein